jgi:membrane protein implicated in regulation of membrane protease activity
MDSLIALLAHLEAPHWFGLGLVLLVAELATGTTYLLWPAVAAWLAGLILLFVPLALPAQLTIFAAATLVATLTGRSYLKGRLLGGGGDPLMNDRALQLVGARVVAVGVFEHGYGRVRLGDSEWRGASPDAIGPGDALVVTSVEGATLHVRRAASVAA